jgi:hypothetical protein
MFSGRFMVKSLKKYVPTLFYCCNTPRSTQPDVELRIQSALKMELQSLMSIAEEK